MAVNAPGVQGERNPQVEALAPIHRAISAPRYVSDERVGHEIDAYLGDSQTDADPTKLKLQYLYDQLWLDRRPLERAPWGQLFGNFMGTIGALDVLIRTAEQDGHGRVSQRDSSQILLLIDSLIQHTRLFARRSRDELPNTIDISVAHFVGAAESIQDVVFADGMRQGDRLTNGGLQAFRSLIDDRNQRAVDNID